MKPLTNTLKTLITEHSIDILQQEQRLKAMLADLLPHDKQMRFLLELSLRAQIPQKLIAQQNETRLGWEAQIKSLKHYFKDEYFLEDKAVNSVFDCWVEVLPRKKQAAAPPKLGNLNANSRFKDIETIIWHKLAFKQNSNWEPFFEKSNITNFQSFFKDIGIIKNANHTGSYPKIVFPNSLQNEVSKQPPMELPSKTYRKSELSLSMIPFLEKENGWTKEDTDRYIKLCAEEKYKENKEFEKYKKDLQLVKDSNDDSSKTFKIEQFINLGSILGYDLSTPEAPIRPFSPSKQVVPKTYEKYVKSFGIGFLITLLMIIVIIIFYVLSDIYIARMILGIPLVLSVLGLIGVVFSGQIFEADFWVNEFKKTLKYSEAEVAEFEAKENEYYLPKINNYTIVLLPKYNKELTEFENKKQQQIKVLNEAFPLIVRQMWLQAMVANINVFIPGNSINNGALVKNLVARLGLQYPKYLKVNTKVFDIQSEIILNIDNKICINIEIDEPFNRETRQETHFVGSNDEKRDNVFVENNWFVLRFTESQVNYALAECISIVQELVQFTQNGNTQHLIKLNELSRSIEVLCWTKEEARLMTMNED